MLNLNIVLLLSAFPVWGQVSHTYIYQPPTQRIINDETVLREETALEAVGTKSANALRDFAAMKLPRKSLSDVARSMIQKVEFTKDMIGPSFDRPVREMMNDIMDSTPEDLMHGLIDPIMSSTESQKTMEELDRLLAELILSEIGDVPLDFIDQVFGGKTVSALIAYASEILPRITAAQFAAQLMFQFQVKLAPVMKAMTTTTVRELVEPMIKVLGKIPDSTPSEAIHMLAEPMMTNEEQVKLGTVDEKTAEFIEQLQNTSTTPQRTFNDLRVVSIDVAHHDFGPLIKSFDHNQALNQVAEDSNIISYSQEEFDQIQGTHMGSTFRQGVDNQGLGRYSVVSHSSSGPGGRGSFSFSQNVEQFGTEENQSPKYDYYEPENPLQYEN